MKSFDENRQFLIEIFNATLDDKVRRRSNAPVHQVLPSEWFAPASRECRDMFVDGHFYGCISLVQSVAEGISRFVAFKNAVRDPGHHISRCAMLKKRGFISLEAYKAFKSIEGGDRNHYHHLNAEIERDRSKLESRATECMQALRQIESDVFEWQVGEGGTMKVKNPQYWTFTDGKYVATHIDFT